MVQVTDEDRQVLEAPPYKEGDFATMEVEPSSNTAKSAISYSKNIKMRTFEKYTLKSQQALKKINPNLQDLSEEDRSRLCVLHFDKFDVLMSKDDPRLPSADNTAQIELCRKLLFNDTKILHFLKITFPFSGDKLTAQILPPGRETAGVKMAAMGGVAVITGKNNQGERRRSPRKVGKEKDSGRCPGSS